MVKIKSKVCEISGCGNRFAEYDWHGKTVCRDCWEQLQEEERKYLPDNKRVRFL